MKDRDEKEIDTLERFWDWRRSRELPSVDQLLEAAEELPEPSLTAFWKSAYLIVERGAGRDWFCDERGNEKDDRDIARAALQWYPSEFSALSLTLETALRVVYETLPEGSIT